LKELHKISFLIYTLCFIFLYETFFSQNYFAENKGQWADNILFKAKLPNGACFVEANSLTFVFYETEPFKKTLENKKKKIKKIKFHAYRVSFVNSKKAKVEPKEKLNFYENYFIGNDKKRWASKVNVFRKLVFKDLYDNIDFSIFFDSLNYVQYEFIIKKGGNPHEILLKYEGIDSLLKDSRGNIIVKTSISKTLELKPIAYQVINDRKFFINSKFIIHSNKYVAFQLLDSYNSEYDLIIDPTLIFSTYSGSAADNWGFTATYDLDGNGISGGIVFDVGYPTSLGAFQVDFAGGEPYDPNTSWYSLGCDIGIIKYNADGTQRIWATYLGGSLSEELPHSLICTNDNDLVIFGTTGSIDFPVTDNAFDKTFNGGTNILYDNVIRFSNGTDIFITKLSADGTTLIGSTFIGGSGNDGLNFRQYYENFLMEGNDSTLYYNYADGAKGEVIVDDEGNIYVASFTFSTDFPVTNNAFQNIHGGELDGVIFKINSDCSQLIFSSYFGGNLDDACYSLDIDNQGNIYVSGGSLSSNLPTTENVIQPNNPGIGSVNGFIFILSSDSFNLLHCTYWGSPYYDQIYFIRLDKENFIYVVGQTEAPDSTFIINTTFGIPNSGQFVTKISNDLSEVIWSTVFGTGIGKPNIALTAFSVDVCKRIYISGWGREWAGDWSQILGTKNMYVSNDAFQSQTDGQDFYLIVLKGDGSGIEYATFFGELNYQECSYSGHDHVDGGTSRFDKFGNIYQSVCASCGGCNQFPTYPNPGAWSNNNGNINFNCNNALFKFSFGLPMTVAHFIAPNSCINDTVFFTNLSQYATNYTWYIGNIDTINISNPSFVFDSAGIYNITLIAYDTTTCNIADTFTRSIFIDKITINKHDFDICLGDTIQIYITANSIFSNLNYIWASDLSFNNIIGTNPSITVSPASTTHYYVSVYSEICSTIDSIKVNVHYATIDLQEEELIICSNDTITLQANVNYDGTAYYTWAPISNIIENHNSPNPVITASENTMFYVTITNNFGCIGKDSINIKIDKINAYFSNITPIRCNDECNGQISVNVQDNLLPVSYLWSTGSNNSSISNLCFGEYSVTIFNSIGCSIVLDTFLINPLPLEAEIIVLSNASCDSLYPNTGSLTVNVQGGTPPYFYVWNTGAMTNTVSSLYPGTYYVTIYDAHSCSTIKEGQILDPSNLQINIAYSHPKCHNSCDATAFVEIIEDGIPPYKYFWSTGDTLNTINNICSGTYSVTVVDSEYCYRMATINVVAPPPITANLSILPIKCYGEKTQVELIDINGGSPPYIYYWYNGIENIPLISDVPAGNYWIIISDKNNCVDTTYFDINEPPPLTITEEIIEPLCLESCNGKIIVQANGGTPPYKYYWNSGIYGNSISNICPGNYYLTLTDFNFCTMTKEYNISHQDYKPYVDATATPSVIYQGQYTQLNANTNANYNIVWSPNYYLSNPYILNPKANPPVTITYYVKVIDKNNCINIDSITVQVLDVICDEPNIYIPNSFTPNDDGKNDILYVRAPAITDFYFAIYDRWGECVFETTDINKGWDGTYKGVPLDPAVFVYYLKIRCINNLYFEKKGNITLLR